MRFGELLKPDGSLNPLTSVCGQIKGTRKASDGKEAPIGGPGAPLIAWQQDVFIARGGGLECYRPDFTFHGFRFMEITGLPPGHRVTSPMVIEAGHWEARGMIHCAADSPPPTEANRATSLATAKGMISGKELSVPAGSLGEIKRAAAGKFLVYLEPSKEPGDQDPIAPPKDSPATISVDDASIPEVVIKPGSTVTCHLRVVRNNFPGRIQLEIENLPHGIIVDNIGLNGVLIPENETKRTIFLSAEPWVGDQTRLFHAVAKGEGDPASLPIRIRVKK